MSYRRLPKTDMARIRSLKKMLDKCMENGVYSNVLPFKTYYRVRDFLNVFESAQKQYVAALAEQTKQRNTSYYVKSYHDLRLYTSHFIQVLQLAIVRGEVKNKFKSYYGLQSSNVMPVLSSASACLAWSEKIIEGERLRLEEGGTPIYNPTIARVKVQYDMFNDLYSSQIDLREKVSNRLKTVTDMREEADALILEVWNEIEKSMQSYQGEERIKRCSDYGIIYYSRKNTTK